MSSAILERRDKQWNVLTKKWPRTWYSIGKHLPCSAPIQAVFHDVQKRRRFGVSAFGHLPTMPPCTASQAVCAICNAASRACAARVRGDTRGDSTVNSNGKPCAPRAPGVAAVVVAEAAALADSGGVVVVVVESVVLSDLEVSGEPLGGVGALE